MKRLLLSYCALGLAACSAPSWTPDVSLPDTSAWFTKENRIEVEEIFNDAQCHATGADPQLTLLRDSAEIAAWQSQRGLEISAGKPLPQGPFVAVDLGERSSGGYGIAVSRVAGLRRRVLVLRATLFEPGADTMTTQALTSPCAVVRLPSAAFDSIRLIDQSGRVRAKIGG